MGQAETTTQNHPLSQAQSNTVDGPLAGIDRDRARRDLSARATSTASPGVSIGETPDGRFTASVTLSKSELGELKVSFLDIVHRGTHRGTGVHDLSRVTKVDDTKYDVTRTKNPDGSYTIVVTGKPGVDQFDISIGKHSARVSKDALQAATKSTTSPNPQQPAIESPAVEFLEAEENVPTPLLEQQRALASSQSAPQIVNAIPSPAPAVAARPAVGLAAEAAPTPFGAPLTPAEAVTPPGAVAPRPPATLVGANPLTAEATTAAAELSSAAIAAELMRKLDSLLPEQHNSKTPLFRDTQAAIELVKGITRDDVRADLIRSHGDVIGARIDHARHGAQKLAKDQFLDALVGHHVEKLRLVEKEAGFGPHASLLWVNEGSKPFLHQIKTEAAVQPDFGVVANFWFKKKHGKDIHATLNHLLEGYQPPSKGPEILPTMPTAKKDDRKTDGSTALAL